MTHLTDLTVRSLRAGEYSLTLVPSVLKNQFFDKMKNINKQKRLMELCRHQQTTNNIEHVKRCSVNINNYSLKAASASQ